MRYSIEVRVHKFYINLVLNIPIIKRMLEIIKFESLTNWFDREPWAKECWIFYILNFKPEGGNPNPLLGFTVSPDKYYIEGARVREDIKKHYCLYLFGQRFVLKKGKFKNV